MVPGSEVAGFFVSVQQMSFIEQGYGGEQWRGGGGRRQRQDKGGKGVTLGLEVWKLSNFVLGVGYSHS